MSNIPPGVKPIDLSQVAQNGAPAVTGPVSGWGQAPQQPSWRQRLAAAWDALNGRAFGPGEPLPAVLPTNEAAPRQFSYPAAINRNFAPRGEVPGMTPFEQLRNLSAVYDVAAMCIATRIEEMQGLGYAVVAKDKKLQHELQDECEAITDWFSSPDKRNDFSGWLGMVLYDLFSIDALSLYLRPDQNGRLWGVEVIDGATIKPLVDVYGRTVGYQQILYGRPETEFEDAPASNGAYNPDLLWYRPRWRRTFTPYGFPPSEWIILRVNTALRKQAFDLSWFTDGNVPEGFAVAPDGMLNVEQVKEFEGHFNAVLAGNDSERRRIRFLPWNFQFQPTKEMQYNTVLDEWMLRVTCAAYSVPPQELGFTYDVNKGTAEMQSDINQRKGLKPLAWWLKRVVLDPLIQQKMGPTLGLHERMVSIPGQPTRQVNLMKRLEWQWQFGDDEDRLTQAQVHGLDIVNGVISADESRTLRYGDILDGPAPGRPAMVPGEYGAFSPGASPAANSAGDGGAAATMNILRDLKLWQTKAQKAVKSGRLAVVPFVSQVIPIDVRESVELGLAKAASAPEIEQVFAVAREAAAGKFFQTRWCDYE